MATEDKIYALHYPDVFLVELQGGNSPTPSYGLYVILSISMKCTSEIEPHVNVCCAY